MIRAFIALTPPVTLQQSFADVQAALQRCSLAFRWVKPAQVHLTLKFLGDISPETIDPYRTRHATNRHHSGAVYDVHT